MNNTSQCAQLFVNTYIFQETSMLQTNPVKSINTSKILFKSTSFTVHGLKTIICTFKINIILGGGARAGGHCP